MIEATTARIVRNPRDFEYPKPPLLQRLVPRIDVDAILSDGFRLIVDDVMPYALRAVNPAWVSDLDISRYQEDKIMQAFPQLMAGGWLCIFIQATYGITGVDAKFDRFWRAALDAGLWPIPYHFFYAAYDGYVQADHFLRTTETMRNTTGIQAGMVDVEARDGATIATRVTRWSNWCTAFRSHGKVITYSSPNLWTELTGGARLNAADYGMVAHWTGANSPSIPAGWTAEQTKFWQRGVYLNPTHTWITQPPGVTEDVDVDSWMGTLDELTKFLGILPPPPTPPPPPPTHDHADIYARLDALEAKVTALEQG